MDRCSTWHRRRLDRSSKHTSPPLPVWPTGCSCPESAGLSAIATTIRCDRLTPVDKETGVFRLVRLAPATRYEPERRTGNGPRSPRLHTIGRIREDVTVLRGHRPTFPLLVLPSSRSLCLDNRQTPGPTILGRGFGEGVPVHVDHVVSDGEDRVLSVNVRLRRSAHSSPRRMPVVAASRKARAQSGRRDAFAASMSRNTSSGVDRIGYAVFRGGGSTR